MSAQMNPQNEIIEIEAAVEACNAVAVPNPIRVALVSDLKPIAERLAEYRKQADLHVITELDARAAAKVIEKISEDIKTVKEHEILRKITTGLHALHRRWTGLRDMFCEPMESARREIKNKIIAWEQAERAKAEAEERRLQAEADEAARKERERLEREAAKLKTPELKAAKLEQAAQTIAPVIQIQSPTIGIRTQKIWKVKEVNLDKFYGALSQRPELRGFVEISWSKLARAKAANTALEIPGVEFEQVIC